ncbi:MAG: hypothetical protein ACLFU9_02305 [Candidatus Bathyarchaeia archaeon]
MIPCRKKEDGVQKIVKLDFFIFLRRHGRLNYARTFHINFIASNCLFVSPRVSHLAKYAYILLTEEKWWNRRVLQNRAGKKVQAFVRKNKVGPIDVGLLLFYVKHPVRAIRGIGDFEERVVGEIEKLWETYGEETVFESHDEYLDFMKGRTKATFIRFRNLRELNAPIPLKRLLQLMGTSRLPRNGKYLSKETVDTLL